MPGKPVSVEIHEFKRDSGDHRNFFLKGINIEEEIGMSNI